MTQQDSVFSSLESALQEQGPDGVLDALEARLLADQRYHELFEVEKMRLRKRFDLPLVATGRDELPSGPLREQFDDGLVDACRRVGLLLMQAGRLREGWHYLRAAGDVTLVRQTLTQLQPSEDNLEEFLELAIQEGLDLQRGFQLMLEHYGVCNTITTFDSAMYGQPRARRAVGAALLVRHVLEELKANVRAHIERHEGQPPADAPLSTWIASRPWLFENGTYHLDTTHLASVIGFARDLMQPADLKMAVELAEYGRRLDPSLQYAGDPPFDPLYETSLRYFRALLGEDLSEQLAFFRQRAEAVKPREETTMGIEAYIDLLSRVGEDARAIAESIRLLPADVQQTGRAPSLLELAEASGDFETIKQVARQRQDPLGYAIGLLRSAGH